MNDFRDMYRKDQAPEEAVKPAADEPSSARSLGRRDLSKLPIDNLAAYKDWCDDVNDTWQDS